MQQGPGDGSGHANPSDLSSATLCLETVEAVLLDKIRERSAGEGEAEHLKSTLRFFDSAGKGSLDLPNFSRALERYGIFMREAEMQALFAKYDSGGRQVVHCYEHSLSACQCS